MPSVYTVVILSVLMHVLNSCVYSVLEVQPVADVSTVTFSVAAPVTGVSIG